MFLQASTHNKSTAIPAAQHGRAIQPALEVGQAGDRYEQEADAVADQVMWMPEPAVQRKCAACEEEELQRKPLVQLKAGTTGDKTVQPWIQRQIVQSRGGGQPLPEDTRSFMETRMGSSFEGVSIHTDSQAVQMNRELGARAFTVGNDIFFNSGEYTPESSDGKHLLAHELAHTVQQRGISTAVQRTDDEDTCDRTAISNARRAAAIRTQVVYHHLSGVHPTLGRRQQYDAIRTARELIHPDLSLSQTTEIVGNMVSRLGSDAQIVCGPERDECNSWNAYVVGNRLPIHLCNSWFNISEEQQIRTLIHEAAHAAGIGEPESELYLPIWDCETGANNFHSADAWAHFIHCDSNQTPDQPEEGNPD